MEPNTLADRITQLRRGRGLSQEQLAEALQVSRQAVSKWEVGQSLPELDTLVAMARYFGVSTDWLLTGEQPAAATPQAGSPAAGPMGPAAQGFGLQGPATQGPVEPAAQGRGPQDPATQGLPPAAPQGQAAPQPAKSRLPGVLAGAVMLGAGMLLMVGILVVGALYIQQMTAWSNAYSSKLMFAIFAGKSRFNDGANGLGLGAFFVGGIALALAGVGIMLYAAFSGRRAGRLRSAAKPIENILLCFASFFVFLLVVLFLFSIAG